jgi:hypothetical protein
MDHKNTDVAAGASALVAAVNETLAVLARSSGGLSALELAEEQRIRQACERLGQAAARLAAEDVVVAGSMGQLRPHPLLKVEQDLRREITDALRKLDQCAENRVLFEQARALTRRPRPNPSPGAENRAASAPDGKAKPPARKAAATRPAGTETP